MVAVQRLSIVLVVYCGCLLAEICPPDWHRYGESCYLFAMLRVDWFEANHTCAQSEANLAVPTSRFEQDFIWKLYLKVFDQKPPSSLWIGCNDIEEEGNWQHCPLKGETNAYENWAGRQPNNANNADCAVMRVDMNGTWDDQHCINLNLHAVCELPVYNSRRLTPQCLLRHAMDELQGTSGKDYRSRPRCHSFMLDNCGHQ
ncbi:lectin BRA-3-like [Asterias rubens]|uniref:lectin BRA-3-like n=1 Tax=Asterias rubens TaxID=7604 RepID=UPI0014557C7B|nr:lectin BRA-3-like [Asterias rubens]